LPATAERATANTDRRLRITPLGGLGEFGLNSLLVEWQEQAILVDAGAMVPSPDTPGVDSIAPDFRALRQRRLHGIFLTHGHDDHIGALAFALREQQAPVFGSPLTLGLAQRRLRDRGVSGEMRALLPGQPVEAGPFRVYGIRVAHSVSDSLALAIETPVGTLIHSGDFKLDSTVAPEQQTDLETLAQWGERGVLALLSDSTNVERCQAARGEDDVIPAFEDVFARARGRVLVSCFSTALPRIERVARLAQRAGRQVCFLGRRMLDNVDVALEHGQLDIRPEYRIAASQAAGYPADKLTLFVSGSQGEPGSALSGLARGDHRGLTLGAEDTLVLSARVIPGCERSVSRVMGGFFRQGCTVVHPGSALVHVSGHGHRDDLAELLRLVKPRYFVPLHGEYRMLAQHARLAAEFGVSADRLGLIEDGDVLALDETSLEKIAAGQSGRLLLDPSGDSPVEACVVRERRELGIRGLVVPIMVIDKDTRRLHTTPRLIGRGVFDSAGARDMLEEASGVAAACFEDRRPTELEDNALAEERLRGELRRFFRKRAGRRPLISPVIVEI